MTLAELTEASPSLAPLLPQLERAAKSDASVLIVGEPGTGRTSLARAMHAASPRASAPLVEVDVAVIPSSLFESELFGHVAGAFTSADSSRTGRVERAEGGSLVLDQIEELPTLVQPKLLRLIAERKYSPLGGRDRSADLRFLALASQELQSRVRRRAFREDLYYRLEVLAFVLPPLRNRSGDLPTLARAILVDLAERHGWEPPRLAVSSLAWMRDAQWLGNLRELRNLLERAMIMHDGGELVIEARTPSDGGRPRSLEEAERQAIRHALAFTRGHQTRAAEILGISRKALWQKRRRLGLP